MILAQVAKAGCREPRPRFARAEIDHAVPDRSPQTVSAPEIIGRNGKRIAVSDHVRLSLQTGASRISSTGSISVRIWNGESLRLTAIAGRTYDLRLMNINRNCYLGFCL